MSQEPTLGPLDPSLEEEVGGLSFTAEELDPDDDWSWTKDRMRSKSVMLPRWQTAEETKPVQEEGDPASEALEKELLQRVKMFFVLVHGNNGNGADWTCIRKELYDRFGSSVLIMTSTANSHSTHEGIEVGGRNLTCEIASFINQAFLVGPRTLASQRYALFVKSSRFGVATEPLQSDASYVAPNPLKEHTMDSEAEKEMFMINSSRMAADFIRTGSQPLPMTIIGHSLGGLYGRNATGWLFNHGFFPQLEGGMENPLAPLIPHGYISICTPHLGSRRPGGSLARATWKTMVHTVLNHINGQTGIELLLEDHVNHSYNQNSSRIQATTAKPDAPLLSVMTEPHSIYVEGLNLFKKKTLIAITHYDTLVPYASAAIVGHNPYAMPLQRKTFAVVGSYGFSYEHSLSIEPYQDPSLSSATDEMKELKNDANQSRRGRSRSDIVPNLPGLGSPTQSASVVGIANRSCDGLYHTDTNLEVEYLSEILTNLQSLHWR